MGFLDRLFGREEKHDRREARERSGDYGEPRRMSDEQAVERYKYLLRTAPPEAIEQAHEEAFAKLSPEQRRMVLDQLSQEAPASERVKDPNDTRALARMATRGDAPTRHAGAYVRRRRWGRYRRVYRRWAAIEHRRGIYRHRHSRRGVR